MTPETTALVQRIVIALRADECGHVLGSVHAGTCPVCRCLAELLVAVSADTPRTQAYYDKALNLLADELMTLAAPLPPERGIKMAAILRNAAVTPRTQEPPTIDQLDQSPDVATALEKVRSLVKSEAGHIAYLDDDLNDLIRAVREETTATLTAESQQLKWQPIETAPKDGSWVLVYAWQYGMSIIGKGYWYQGKAMNETSGWICRTVHTEPTEMHGSFSDPTHWMPLPAPPLLAVHPVSERR